mgnify:CR=1 FL=1
MTKDLTGGSPLKVILFFTLPLVLGNLFQLTYNAADSCSSSFTRWQIPSS